MLLLFELLVVEVEFLFVEFSVAFAADDEFDNFSTTAFNNPLRLLRVVVEDELPEMLVDTDVFFRETEVEVDGKLLLDPLNAATIAGSIPPNEAAAAIAIVAASKELVEFDVDPLKNGRAAAITAVIALLLLFALLLFDKPNDANGFIIDDNNVGFVAISAAKAVSARKLEAALFPCPPLLSALAITEFVVLNELLKLFEC